MLSRLRRNMQSLFLLAFICCLLCSRVYSLAIHHSKSSLNTRALSSSSSSRLFGKGVSSANLDWPNLGFEYRSTDSFVQCTYRDGKWGPVEVVRGEPYVKIHIGATALHYGQACFEGLKVHFHHY